MPGHAPGIFLGRCRVDLPESAAGSAIETKY
jgi:hypothetical protein